MRVTDKYVFFFTEKDIFSNWYPSAFTYEGRAYWTVEHFMMSKKAHLFEDYDIAYKINTLESIRKNENSNAFYKRMGRSIKNFNEEVWIQYREQIIKTGLLMKYQQNPELKAELMKYSDKHFVEASPYDEIYGIKMGMWDEGVEVPSNWKGTNLLGQWHNDLIKYFQSGKYYEL